MATFKCCEVELHRTSEHATETIENFDFIDSVIPMKVREIGEFVLRRLWYVS